MFSLNMMDIVILSYGLLAFLIFRLGCIPHKEYKIFICIFKKKILSYRWVVSSIIGA